MGLIYLDSCLLIYLLEHHPALGPLIKTAIEKETSAAKGAGEPKATASRFAISGLTKMECLVKPMRVADLVLQRHFEDGFRLYQPLEMTEVVFLRAAELRARFGLKTPDALHLACAQHHGCSALWTNDDRLARAGHGLAINILR